MNANFIEALLFLSWGVLPSRPYTSGTLNEILFMGLRDPRLKSEIMQINDDETYILVFWKS